MVVITRDGSLGSGALFDWENLRADRFSAASSVVKELGYDLNNCRCVDNCKETIKVANRSCVSCKEGDLVRIVNMEK